jgi:hypothetical protein
MTCESHFVSIFFILPSSISISPSFFSGERVRQLKLCVAAARPPKIREERRELAGAGSASVRLGPASWRGAEREAANLLSMVRDGGCGLAGARRRGICEREADRGLQAEIYRSQQDMEGRRLGAAYV